MAARWFPVFKNDEFPQACLFLSPRSSHISPIFANVYTVTRWLLSRCSRPGVSAQILKTGMKRRMAGFRLLKLQHRKTMFLSSLRSSNISPIFTNPSSSRRWLLGGWSRPPLFSAQIHKKPIRLLMIGLCLLKQSHRD